MHGGGTAWGFGFRMMNNRGSTSRKTIAMERNVSTKACIAACRCTMPQIGTVGPLHGRHRIHAVRHHGA